MKTNIFVPEEINVGFQNRGDTYTGKLAYVIYFDEKGKLRKEASWDSWRDKEIENIIYKNEPMTGFVLNKKAGGYDTGWNHRQTYVRVYDPRGFEFEISVPNLLYILENTNSIKGKGLEGEFIYGWDGTELLLMPTEAPDYLKIKEYNKIVHANEFIKAKELKIGATYLTKDNRELIFLGKYDEYDYNGKKKKGKSFYFYDRKSKYYKLEVMRAVTRKLISIASEECVEDYAHLIDEMECDSKYSPIDENKAVYIPYTYEEFTEKLTDKSPWLYCYNQKKQKVECNNYNNKLSYYIRESDKYGHINRIGNNYTDAKTLEELFDIVKPMYRQVYLTNGKLYREEKY